MRAALRHFVSLGLGVFLGATSAAMARTEPTPSACPIHGDIPLVALFASPSKPLRSGRGDEGKSNAENGADLWFEAAKVTDAKSLVLRIELSITDR